MARPVLSAISSESTGSGDTLTVDAPSGVAEGDLILVWIFSVTSSSGHNGTVTTPPTGFEPILVLTQNSIVWAGIYGKVATGSEPSSYSFTLGASTAGWSARSGICDNADLSDFPDSAVEATSTVTGTAQLLEVTGITVPADALLLATTATRVTGATITSEDGMTELWATINLSSRSSASFQEDPAEGATGTRTFDMGGSTSHTAGIVGLSPAASGGGGHDVTFAASIPLQSLAATVDHTAPTDTVEFAGTVPLQSLAAEVATTPPTFDAEFAASVPLQSLAASVTHEPPTDTVEFAATVPMQSLAATVNVSEPGAINVSFAAAIPLQSLAAEAEHTPPTDTVEFGAMVPMQQLAAELATTAPGYAVEFAGAVPMQALVVTLDHDAPVYTVSFVGTIPMQKLTTGRARYLTLRAGLEPRVRLAAGMTPALGLDADLTPALGLTAGKEP